MGSALLHGWIARGLDPRHVIVQDPSPPADAKSLLGEHAIALTSQILNLPVPPAVIVVAVKPQVMDQVFPELAKLAGPQTLVLSIAAGKSLASFERYLPAGIGVVRAMPNTPAAIGCGMTGAVANRHLTAEQKVLAWALLAAVGEVVWVPDEAAMDVVTAVSGSGPAYVFLLAEVLATAGEAAGLDGDTAAKLARGTVFGAGQLLQRSDLSAEILRQNVTSPGGTTAAALSVLMRDGGFESLMREAVAAAVRRSRELGS
jgi:pyrroline-5-carboxylate reductase